MHRPRDTRAPPEAGRSIVTPRARGVSLIELLVVLVILGILMALVPPAIHNQVTGARFEQATSGLTSGLKYARSRAVLQHKEVGVRFDLARRTYEVTGEPGTQRPLPEDMQVRVVTGRSEITSATSGAIQFYPDGTSTGGEIHLMGEGRRLMIEVSWLTGGVRVHGPASTQE